MPRCWLLLLAALLPITPRSTRSGQPATMQIMPAFRFSTAVAATALLCLAVPALASERRVLRDGKTVFRGGVRAQAATHAEATWESVVESALAPWVG